MRWSRAMRSKCWPASKQLDERAPDYREVLAELAALLQKLALLQAVPDLQLDEAEDIETYQRLAAALDARKTRSCSIRSPSSVVATWSLRPMRAADSRWCCCACWRSESRTVRTSAALSRARLAPSQGCCRRAAPKPPRSAAAAAGDCEGLVCDRRADEPARHGQGSSRRIARSPAGRATRCSWCSMPTASISAGRARRKAGAGVERLLRRAGAARDVRCRSRRWTRPRASRRRRPTIACSRRARRSRTIRTCARCATSSARPSARLGPARPSDSRSVS